MSIENFTKCTHPLAGTRSEVARQPSWNGYLHSPFCRGSNSRHLACRRSCTLNLTCSPKTRHATPYESSQHSPQQLGTDSQFFCDDYLASKQVITTKQFDFSPNVKVAQIQSSITHAPARSEY
ncbi:hypothetical protein AVEN_168140-1 [Araneus ventricosus]|uniref:Uncharacterized protein n=1 Tax=Araneus ventricosus TaxID=182803 RepID=A0A4Y2SW05_ARAVE|nr:hypothetical protein AVEN_168140-1 [Araneus ventricosus]